MIPRTAAAACGSGEKGTQNARANPDLFEGVEYHKNVSSGQFPSGDGVRAPQGFELALEPDNFRSRPLAHQLGASMFLKAVVSQGMELCRPRVHLHCFWVASIPGEIHGIAEVRSRSVQRPSAAGYFDSTEASAKWCDHAGGRPRD